MLKDPSGHPIRAIAYHGDVPHSVTAGSDIYDFDYCKRDDCVYYRLSGSGFGPIELARMAFPETPAGRCGLWLAPGESATVDGGSALEAAGYDLITEQPPNPFDDAIEESTYWCEWCDDYLPYDDSSLGIGAGCEHLCEECGEPAPATLEADYERLCGQCCIVVDQDGVELWRGEHATHKLCWNEWGKTWWEPFE
jgi:hypothetical protein